MNNSPKTFVYHTDSSNSYKNSFITSIPTKRKSVYSTPQGYNYLIELFISILLISKNSENVLGHANSEKINCDFPFSSKNILSVFSSEPTVFSKYSELSMILIFFTQAN